MNSERIYHHVYLRAPMRFRDDIWDTAQERYLAINTYSRITRYPLIHKSDWTEFTIVFSIV